VNAISQLKGEVSKRFRLELHDSWVAAKVLLAPAAVVMSLAAFSGSVGTVRGAAQTSAETEVKQTSGAPVITAKPEHVTVARESGSTEIQWDTGNGSAGFVFVTASGRKPVLFATGAKGSLVAPWIRAGNYLFELYSDDERRTLLAAVTATSRVRSDSSSPYWAAGSSAVAMSTSAHRTVAPRRERAVELALPPIRSADDILAAIKVVSGAVGRGAITPGEGFTLSQMIETFLRAIDASDFEGRLRQLEEDQAVRREDTVALRHNWAARFDSSPRRD